MSQIESDPLSMFSFDLSPDLRIPELPGFSFSTENGGQKTVAGPKKNSFSKVPTLDKVSSTGNNNLQKTKKTSSYTKVIHEIAENPLTDEFISWTKDGKFLYVRDSTKLCGELERGKYFRSSKFASIVRNLNYHCFRKLRFDELDIDLRDELDRDTYLNGARHLFYHPYFQRGRDDLLHMIKSQKTDSDKKNEAKKQITEQANSIKANTSDTLDIRLVFARKEAEFINTINQKDALIAEKDAEIATLRALVEQDSINKRKLNHVSSYEDVKKLKSEPEVDDYDALFDDFGKQGYFGDDMDDLPDMIQI